MSSDFKEGDKVKYIGKGFLSYDPKDNNMTFVKKDVGLISDVWVEYKGEKMLVRSYEIEKSK